MKPTTILTAAVLAGLLGLVAATGRAGGGKAGALAAVHSGRRRQRD